MSELIDNALKSATDTKAVAIGEGAVARTAELFTQCFGDSAAIVVGDERTMQVAGNAVQENLKAAGIPVREPHVFPGDPELYAKYDNCEILRDALRDVDAVSVAVGAGTLNDIVKRATAELERPYMQVSTAASMDGYTAFGSSIAKDGYKQTLSGPAPRASVNDIAVMAEAPQTMTASGFGDLIGKVPAGADWIIADALGVEAIDEGVWDLVQGPLRKSLSRPDALAAGDTDAVRDLSEGLVMSGLAMQAHQSSRPASGAEHQFSHLWEMEGHGVDAKPRLSHGFKVGLGTVSICALYEVLLRRGMGSVDVDAAVSAWRSKEDLETFVRKHHKPELQDEFVAQQTAKWISDDDLRTRLEKLKALWPQLAPKLADQLMPASEVQRLLRVVGAPAHPDDIGMDWEHFKSTYSRSQMIRKRYTVLDVVFESNTLDNIVEELFAPDGFWGEQQP